MASQAIKISGRDGRHNHINGTYEPTGQTHNNAAVWVSRDVASLYLFHTGKARWVVSKTLDDGARCYAFMKDPGNTSDPVSCKSPIQCCGDDGTWAADPKVTITGAVASNDSFMKLRLSIDQDLDGLGLNDKKSLVSLWKRLDFNGNNIVSLAEIDKLVVEMVAGGTWPAWLNNKPALMRAYKKTVKIDSDKGDDWVRKEDFHALMLNVFWFNKLFKVFDNMDGDDRRIDAREFQQGMSQMGLQLSQQEATAEFQKIDVNGGGQVLFVEFCAYIRKRVNPDHDPKFDSDIVGGETVGKAVQESHGHAATHTHFVSKKNFRDFDELEDKIKAICADKAKQKDMWKHLDYNGNNIVSLAEIDKWVVENYPLLNHKPALMRCYKCTIINGSKHDSWVHRKDMKKMLVNLFYFNKLYWMFAQCNDDDVDRRMTFVDFQKCLTLCRVTLSDAEAHAGFSECDKNGGGMILFDEFCHYFASKSCPQGMTDMVDDGEDRTGKDGTGAVLHNAIIKPERGGHHSLLRGSAAYEAKYGHR